MKKIILPLFALPIVFFSCSQDKNQKETSLIEESETLHNKESQSDDEPLEEKVLKAISLYDSGIRDKPARKDAKWVSGVKFGETVELTGDTSYNDSEKAKYIKVKLSNGKEGWDKEYLYAVDATVGVVTTTMPLFDRPDILAIADKKVEKGEIVAIYNDGQEEWSEIVAKKKSKKGWVKKSNGLSVNEKDIVLNLLMNKIEAAEDEGQKELLVAQVLEDNSYASSAFYDEFIQKYGPKELDVNPEDVQLETETSDLQENELMIRESNDDEDLN